MKIYPKVAKPKPSSRKDISSEMYLNAYKAGYRTSVGELTEWLRRKYGVVIHAAYTMTNPKMYTGYICVNGGHPITKYCNDMEISFLDRDECIMETIDYALTLIENNINVPQ